MNTPARVDGRLDVLLRSAVELATEHDPEHVLHRMVRCAAEVAQAQYAALGVYDRFGRMERFVHHGLDDATVARIGDHPVGRGLLGEVIVADGPIRLSDIGSDERSCGFPEHHPAMRSFLGVPVRLGDRRFGNLYVTEKHGARAFDEDDERLVVTFAAFAAAAIEAALLVSTERELAAAQTRSRVQQEMFGRVMDAQEAERARIARDLHDQIGQSLTSVLLSMRLVDRSLASDDPDLAEARSRTDDVRHLVAQALEEVRQLAFDLRPTVLDDIGLVAAVQRLAGNLARRYEIRVDVALDGLDDDARLPAEVETVVYRVVQEALTNVARHADAARVGITISTSVDPPAVRAVVADDGKGFEVSDDLLGTLGLAGMQERATLVHGRLDIESTPGVGTTVMVEAPL
jgi:signal transduction histidine kinase